MSYISPNGEVIFLEGIRIDKKHNHTIRFNSLTSQTNFFTGKQKSDVIIGDKIVYFRITDQTYTRVNNGVMKVAIPADYLRSCNYMMFRNTAYSGKWFYAFIDNVEYNNNSSCYVTFSIDLIQTWWFDFDMNACFVEREHTETDGIGENLVSEDLETGEYVYANSDFIDLSEMSVGILSTVNPVTNKNEGSLYNGIYSGLYHATRLPLRGVTFEAYVYAEGEYPNLSYRLEFSGDSSVYTTDNYTVYDTDEPQFVEVKPTVADCKIRFYWVGDGFAVQGYSNNGVLFSTIANEVEGFVNRPLVTTSEGVILPTPNNSYYVYRVSVGVPSAYVVDERKMTTAVDEYIKSFKDPTAIVAMYQYPTVFDRSDADTVYTSPRNFARPITLTDGYTPRNNKLFIAPYNKVVVSNNDGANAEYRWELCANHDIMKFTLYGSKYGIPCCLLTPYDYKNKNLAYDDGLPLSNFPQCSWNSDVFKTWWNQNKASFVTSLISGSIQNGARGAIKGGMAGGAVGAVVGGAIGVANKIAGSVAKNSDVMAIPPQANGQIQCESLNVGLKRVGYTIYYVSLKPEFLAIIDDYFDMFGYAVKQVKIPNIKKGSAFLRPKWNYIETKNCCIIPLIGSGLSASDIEGIQGIFDRGITFWENNSDIGNYSLNNRPNGG